jgi:hypothetical protein
MIPPCVCPKPLELRPSGILRCAGCGAPVVGPAYSQLEDERPDGVSGARILMSGDVHTTASFQTHGASQRTFFQGQGATAFAASWGHRRGRTDRVFQGHGASPAPLFSGARGQPGLSDLQ